MTYVYFAQCGGVGRFVAVWFARQPTWRKVWFAPDFIEASPSVPPEEWARKVATGTLGSEWVVLQNIGERFASAALRASKGKPPWPAPRKAAPKKERPPPRQEHRAPPRPRASPIGPSWAYRTLGVPSGAPFVEVKRAWRKLVLIAHPDRGGSAARFIEVTKAWDALRIVLEAA